MSEFSELYGDSFFIIDSNNFRGINDKLYGFSILNNTIVKEEDIDSNTLLSGFGAYVHIKDYNEKISIYQDSNGSWGLYLYKYDDYFAISNSFLYLVEYLKSNHYLSLNEDYASCLMFVENIPLTFKQTLINEIERIPSNCAVHIDKINGEILFEKIDYNIHSIPLDSQNALDVLDDWFYRWIEVFRFIKKNTNNIEFDLEGSIDSKIILMFALFANIDCSQICFKINPQDILSDKINNEFYSKLNQKNFSGEKIYFNDLDTILDLACYIYLGFSNKPYYNFFRTSEPIYNFSGSTTKMINFKNNFNGKSFYQILDYCINNSKFTDQSLAASFQNLLFSSLDELKFEFGISNEDFNVLFDLIYDETILSNYFGKFVVSEFLTNKFIISPFMDSNLHKLKLSTVECNDQNLLYAVILTRYFPKFLKFTNINFNISENTFDYAIKINRIKPFILKDFDHISCHKSIKDYGDANEEQYSIQDINNYLINAFKSLGFKMDFASNFSYRIYFDLLNHIENTNDDLRYVYSSFQVLKIVSDIKEDNDFKFSEWVSNLIKRNHFHSISDIQGNNENLDSKISINHTHEFLSRNQVKNLQKLIKDNRIFKKIDFYISNNIISENEPIKLFNLNIIDFDNNFIKINFNELHIIIDNQFSIPFTEISLISDIDSNKNYYNIPTFNLTSGQHELCLRYKDTYSDDIKFFVKYENNLFDENTWLSLDISNFNKFQVESISCTDEWADIFNNSIKVVCNEKNNYQALVTPKQQVCPNDFISAYVTIYNPEEEVIVRLLESSISNYNDIVVSPSESPKRINISRIASSNTMQLLLISRVKQVFYADNFVFTITNRI